MISTIQADQDDISRAGSSGALVVDGGPGTGKTVIALPRCAYLPYADPRLNHHRGGVLFVGPHQPHLAYVGNVLPNLGEEGVQTRTLRETRGCCSWPTYWSPPGHRRAPKRSYAAFSTIPAAPPTRRARG